MELAVLWNRGPGLVPRHPLLHELRQGGILPRLIAAPCSSWQVQAQGRALPRHPRARSVRRSSTHRLVQASQPTARMGQRVTSSDMKNVRISAKAIIIEEGRLLVLRNRDAE